MYINGKSGGSYSDTKIDRIGAMRPKQFNPGKNDTRGGFGVGEIEGGNYKRQQTTETDRQRECEREKEGKNKKRNNIGLHYKFHEHNLL
jgi:hypothetical protein